MFSALHISSFRFLKNAIFLHFRHKTLKFIDYTIIYTLKELSWPYIFASQVLRNNFVSRTYSGNFKPLRIAYFLNLYTRLCSYHENQEEQENLRMFRSANSHFIVTRGSVSLSSATIPYTSCFSKSSLQIHSLRVIL